MLTGNYTGLCCAVSKNWHRAASHAAAEQSRGGCSSGQVGIDAIHHHLNHPHYDYFY